MDFCVVVGIEILTTILPTIRRSYSTRTETSKAGTTSA